MKRYDQRTPAQISLQRINHLLALTDHDLCSEKQLRCQWLTRTDQPGLCTYRWFDDTGAICRCSGVGEMWGIQIPGLPGVHRRCTTHAAQAVRARLWLQKRRLQRGMT